MVRSLFLFANQQATANNLSKCDAPDLPPVIYEKDAQTCESIHFEA